MKKRVLSLLLALFLALSLMPAAVWAEGTQANATEIATADDLLAFAAAVNAGDNFAGKTVKLTADIDLAGIQWQPIGGDTVYFAGEFDGNGKTISNLTNTGDAARKGLFGLVEKCYIHDLTLKNVKFSGNTAGARIGALAGNLQYYNVVKNVTVDGLDYDLNDTDGLIGGLAGYVWTSYVKNCVVKNADMNISSTGDSAVGVMIAYGRGVTDPRTSFPYAGQIEAADYQDASLWNYCDSKVEGAVINLSGTVSFGGFLGADTYNHWRNFAKNNTVTGLSVTCAAGNGVYTVGGFMSGQYGGYSDEALLNNSVAGTITSAGSNTASTYGGFFGYVGGRPGGATGCTADVDITVTAGDVGGFCGETQQYFAHAYEFDGCEAKGDISTDNGTAGGFIANIQHGGDGSALNTTITDCTASGTVSGTVEGGIVGNVNDDKNGSATGGTIVLQDNTNATGTKDVGADAHGVVPEAYIGEVGYKTLADAIAAAADGDVIVLADGTHTMPSINTKKVLTIKGSANVVIKLENEGYGGGVGTADSTLTFDGVTVEFNNNGYRGFKHTAKLTYTDCTIYGLQFLYAPTVEFTNCVIENKADYSVWTYAATDVTFTDCIFNAGGKAVLVYNEAMTGYVADIKLTNCVFNDDDSLNTVKAAVETGIVITGEGVRSENIYKLTFTGCTVNGFALNDEGISTGSTLWGNKNSMDDEHLIVNIVPVLTGISVSDLQPGYLLGQGLNLTGAKVDLTYDTGATGEVALTADMISGYDPNTAGQQILTVTYGGLTTQVQVSVIVPMGPGTVVTPVEPPVADPDPVDPPAEEDCDGGITCPSYSFVDVIKSAWYHESIDYVVVNGLMNGVAPTSFAPDATTTRAMIWTVLARQAGEETSGGATWYALAQAWAKQVGVSDGTGPDDQITREQLVTMLYRSLGSPAITNDVRASLGSFTDADKVSDWAEDAMAWAVYNGIINGMTESTIVPQGSATRAQVAAMLMRFCELIAK